jgi:hypothetical protein
MNLSEPVRQVALHLSRKILASITLRYVKISSTYSLTMRGSSASSVLRPYALQWIHPAIPSPHTSIHGWDCELWCRSLTFSIAINNRYWRVQTIRQRIAVVTYRMDNNLCTCSTTSVCVWKPFGLSD